MNPVTWSKAWVNDQSCYPPARARVEQENLGDQRAEFEESAVRYPAKLVPCPAPVHKQKEGSHPRREITPSYRPLSDRGFRERTRPEVDNNNKFDFNDRRSASSSEHKYTTKYSSGDGKDARVISGLRSERNGTVWCEHYERTIRLNQRGTLSTTEKHTVTVLGRS